MNLIYQLIAVGIFLFMGIPCIHSDVHSLVTSYTQIEGTRQEFYSVTELDGKTVFYNNSKIKNLTYNQEWIKKIMSKEDWKRELQNREKMQEIFEKNIHIMKGRLNANEGTQTFQRTFGCKWDDKNNEVEAFDTYAYDGQDFISLEMQEKKYLPFLPQALHTRDIWNRDQNQLDFLLNYYNKDCIFWLKEMWNLRKTDLKKKGFPEVSLLQKDPTSPVVCHVTGFHSVVDITWNKNSFCRNYGQNEEILLNEDGTFQQSVALIINPEDWNRWTYYCEVSYNGNDEYIWIVASKLNYKVKSNFVSMKGVYIIVSVVVAVAAVLAFVLIKWCISRPALLTQILSLLKQSRKHY